jgi:hypothetical protein
MFSGAERVEMMISPKVLKVFWSVIISRRRKGGNFEEVI